MDEVHRELFAKNGAQSDKEGRESNLESPCNASIQALEAILRNPVRFVPATILTHNDQGGNMLSALYPPIESTPHGDTYQQNGCLQIKQKCIRLPPTNTPLATQTISAQWLRQASGMSSSKGFFNRHVMCYRNSMIQALLHAPKLVNWLEEFHPPCAQESRCIICALRQLSLQYWQTSSVPQDLNQKMNQLESNLRGTLAFTNWTWSRQQDANEFFLHLVNSMIERHPK